MSDDDSKPVTSLPFGVRLSRVELDLATIAILSVVTARNRMIEFLSLIYRARTPGENLTPTDTVLTLLFNDAWIIVDRLNMLRKVLGNRLDDAPAGTNAAEFRDTLGPVYLARNGIQHIDQDTVAQKTRKADFPILGIITAVMFDPAQMGDAGLTHLDQVVLSHSELHTKLKPPPFPEKLSPILPPVDHIRLHAFGQVIDLSRAVALAEGLTNVLTQRALTPPGTANRLSVVVTAKFDPPLKATKVGTT